MRFTIATNFKCLLKNNFYRFSNNQITQFTRGQQD